ncbi:MAG: response regulator [bacterium]
MSEGRILIIDDDDKTRSAYKDLLTGCGFDTRVAENEIRALELLRCENYHAVLLDLMVSGNVLVAVAERIKKEFPTVFISLMIVDSTPALIKRAIDAGIDEYLVKPLLPMRLIDGVKKGILRYTLEEENRQLKQKLEEIQAQNRKWIMHDLETGVFNSRYFSERLDTEIKRAKRHEHWLSLLLCDLGKDAFSIGEEGDNASPADGILELLKIISGNIREVDIITRYNSGFALILPETTAEGSSTLCSRLKRSLAQTFEGNDKDSKNPDASLNPNIRFGSATYPFDSHLPKRLIKIAEDRLQ